MGKPIHFSARYLHSGYLEKDYRDSRRNRLMATPTGGALADLGPHVLSLLILLISAHRLLEFAAIDLVICDNMDTCFDKLSQDINKIKGITNIATTMNKGFLDKLHHVSPYFIELPKLSDRNVNCDTLIILLNETGLDKRLLQLQRKITSTYHKNLLGGGSIAVCYEHNVTGQLFKLISHNPPLINKLYVENGCLLKLLDEIEHNGN
jgi:hypothetical protein